MHLFSLVSALSLFLPRLFADCSSFKWLQPSSAESQMPMRARREKQREPNYNLRNRFCLLSWLSSNMIAWVTHLNITFCSMLIETQARPEVNLFVRTETFHRLITQSWLCFCHYSQFMSCYLLFFGRFGLVLGFSRRGGYRGREGYAPGMSLRGNAISTKH